MVTGGCIVLPVLLQALEQVLFRVPKFIFNLAHYDVVYFLFVIRQLHAHLLVNLVAIALISFSRGLIAHVTCSSKSAFALVLGFFAISSDAFNFFLLRAMERSLLLAIWNHVANLLQSIKVYYGTSLYLKIGRLVIHSLLLVAFILVRRLTVPRRAYLLLARLPILCPCWSD